MNRTLRTSCRSEALGLWILFAFIVSAAAQVNSGSNGSDGAFNPMQNVTIDMADHPTGIYQYTSVNIPSGVTVTFTSNANNTPVVWLVQGDCVIAGNVNANGGNGTILTVGSGGPGGYRGGNGGDSATAGQGPGGGSAATYGGNASFGALGGLYDAPPGSIYGNNFLTPLVGGSGGGGGSVSGANASGGGGAILIAATGQIVINGSITAAGGDAYVAYSFNSANIVGGGASGGGIRLVTPRIIGNGSVAAYGGLGGYHPSISPLRGGAGRVRFDVLENNFNGSVNGTFTQGFQPIIIPASGQGVQLGIQSIGGVSVAASPSGVLANPDVILPAQQTNPMNVVVNCSNLPMNTTITVTVRPANGADSVATGTNSSGTQTASTATIPVTMPRGGGIIYAKCVSGVAGTASTADGDSVKNISETGWTAHGERFAQVEITAGIGSSQHVAYITESGKRYTLPVR